MQRTEQMNRPHAPNELEPPTPKSSDAISITASDTTSAPIASNTPSTNNTSPTRKKTRPPTSPRLKQTQKSATSSPLSRQPASPRKRPEISSEKKALADSFADERQTKHKSKLDLLTESSADDSFNEVGILDFNEFDGSDDYQFKFNEPILRTRSTLPSPNQGSTNKIKALSIDQPLPSAVNMLVGMIWQAIESQNWDKLGNLLDSMYENKFRFDDPTLKDSKHIQQIIQSAPLDLLMGGEGESGVDKISRWLLALDFLDLGCNRDAMDHNGHRAINLLRQQASKSLIDHVVSERPELKHLLLIE